MKGRKQVVTDHRDGRCRKILENRIQVRLLLMLSLMLYMMLLCLTPGCGTNTQQSTASAEEEVSYEIPLVIPLSGQLAYLGEDAQWAAEYAVDEINASGGISGIPVHIGVHDTQSSESQVKSLEKKITGSQRFFIGPIDAVGTAAGAEIIAESKTPNVATYVYESLREKTEPYGISYMVDSIEGEMEAIATWKVLNPDIENVIILVSKGDNAQTEVTKVLEEYLPDLSMNLMDVVSMDLAVNNGLDAVVQALNAKADGYIILSRAAEYGIIVSQLRSRGITEGRRFTASFASFSASVIEEHTDAFQDTYIWNNFDNQYEGERWQTLLTAYQKEHDGKSPDNNIVPDVYNAVYAWKNCMEELGLKPEIANLAAEKQKIAEWFYNSPVQHGVQGDYQWIDGQKKSIVYYFQFDENGVPQSVHR